MKQLCSCGGRRNIYVGEWIIAVLCRTLMSLFAMKTTHTLPCIIIASAEYLFKRISREAIDIAFTTPARSLSPELQRLSFNSEPLFIAVLEASSHSFDLSMLSEILHLEDLYKFSYDLTFFFFNELNTNWGISDPPVCIC